MIYAYTIISHKRFLLSFFFLLLHMYSDEKEENHGRYKNRLLIFC
jgi:hypothetical protein